MLESMDRCTVRGDITLVKVETVLDAQKAIKAQ